MKIAFLGIYYIVACTQQKWPNQVGSLEFCWPVLHFLILYLVPLPSILSAFVRKLFSLDKSMKPWVVDIGDCKRKEIPAKNIDNIFHQ